jgi:hypothetical protein
MIYEATVRVDKDKVDLHVARWDNPHEMASRSASAKLTAAEAFALAAKLVQAGADLLEKELEAAR